MSNFTRQPAFGGAKAHLLSSRIDFQARESSLVKTIWKDVAVKVRELLDEVRKLSVWTAETEKTYKYCVDVLCAEFEHGEPDLDDISVDWLTGYRARCLARLSPVTFNSRRRHLSVLWKHAVKKKYVEENVFLAVKRAPVPEKTKALPKGVLQRYIEVLTVTRRTLKDGTVIDMWPPQFFWLAVVLTFYHTGMRLRQLVGLKWKDIDWGVGSIRLRAETSKTRREWEVPIGKQLEPALLELRRRTIEVVGSNIAERQVFCLPLFSPRTFKHEVMTGDRVMKFFARFHAKQEQLSLDPVRMTAHKLRHTTATQMLRGNRTPLKVVQRLLGHAHPSTTMGYQHPDLEDMRHAVDYL